MSPPVTLAHPRIHLLLLLWFILPPWIAPATSSVWDANEAFYVQTPREMVESGNWISPTFNGNPRLNKPPLAYWPVAALYSWFGVSLVWERLVLAVAATACVLLTWRIGLGLRGPGAGLLAAGILASTFRFQILSRRLLIDVMLLAWILAAFYFFFRWLESGRPRDFRWGCVMIGLGFLTKGPVAFAPLAVILVFVVWRKRDALRSLPWASGGLILAAVAASWPAALVAVEGWGPIRDFIFHENVGRFLGTDFGPRRGYFYYAGVFLADFLPWSILAPFAVWAWLKRGRSEFEWVLLIWLATFLVGFSLSHNKQEYYILPAYPAAALLLSARATERWPAGFRWIAGGALGLAALVVGAGVLSLFPGAWALVLAAVPLLGAAVMLARGRLIGTAIWLTGFFTAAAAILSGPLEAYKPVRPLAESMMESSQSDPAYRDATFGYFRFTAPSLRFYVDRNILEVYDPEPLLEVWEGPAPVLLITDSEGLDQLRSRSRVAPVVLDRGDRISTNFRSMLAALGGEKRSAPLRPVYLIGNRPRAVDRSAD